MNIRSHILLCFVILFSLNCSAQPPKQLASEVKTGAQILIEKHLGELENKRVGLVMNPTARIGDVHVLDTLLALDVNVTALFAPEHGFRGDLGAGEIIEDGVDQASGLPVFSLYGTNKKPTQEMLSKVDLLLFDMQDVGARFYTYNTTMKYIIEAAAEHKKEVWILDRPNPAGGEYVAGWILEEEFSSFVGSYPVPVAHGLTLGELALMASGEGWLETQSKPELKVIEMQGWKRTMTWPDTGLEWVPPSPNLPEFEHAYVYLGTCFIEGTSLSEGRGTKDPFLTVGAPGVKMDREELDRLERKYSVRLSDTSFTPVNLPGKARNPKHEGVRSDGVFIQITPQFNDPVGFGAELMKLIMRSVPDAKYKDFLYLLSGSRKILGETPPIREDDLSDFMRKRRPYLLYE